MSPKEFTAFRLEVSQLQALRAIRDRDGVPVSEQVRRAIDVWIATKDIKRMPVAPVRTARRKRRPKV